MGGLKEYLESDIRFSWKDNNCLGFVSGALEAQGKPKLPDDAYKGFWDSRSAILHYRRVLPKFNASNILDALDNHYERVLTLHPRSGMIVAKKSGDVLGYAFGVVYNDRAFFLDHNGIVATYLRATDLYWKT